MESIVDILEWSGKQEGIIICLCIAVFRIYLEVINFKFSELPITKCIVNVKGNKFANDLHRMGLFFSVGYILLFAPGLLIGS